MSRAAPHSRNAGWAWALVLAVLLLRAAVPQGFMPERSDDGTLTITVCGSGGLVHIPVEKNAPEEKGAPSHCAFAGIGAADLPSAPLLPLIVWRAPEFVERHDAAQRAAALYPRPASRAPPTRA